MRSLLLCLALSAVACHQQEDDYQPEVEDTTADITRGVDLAADADAWYFEGEIPGVPASSDPDAYRCFELRNDAMVVFTLDVDTEQRLEEIELGRYAGYQTDAYGPIVTVEMEYTWDTVRTIDGGNHVIITGGPMDGSTMLTIAPCNG